METQTIDSRVKEAVNENPSFNISALAEELGITDKDVICALPEDMVTTLPKERFDEVAAEIATWGTIMFIVQTDTVVAEIKGSFPIGGHYKIDELDKIFFMSKPFMKRESHSIQFYSKQGNAMFKIFLGRDEKRKINPDQLEKFHAFKAEIKNP